MPGGTSQVGCGELSTGGGVRGREAFAETSFRASIAESAPRSRSPGSETEVCTALRDHCLHYSSADLCGVSDWKLMIGDDLRLKHYQTLDGSEWTVEGRIVKIPDSRT